LTDPLVAASRDAIARGSKSFALASRLFAPVERDRATLLYAWCRHADDVIDGQVDGFGRVEVSAAPAERLAELDARTRAALAGDGGGDLPFAALARVAAETSMPARYPLDLIEGFRSDVEERRFATFDDTLTYCYHVAGCVGVMMAIVMGVDPDDRATLDRACDLGLAFQLDNIARDVIEDAANGRCYLPEDWLAEAGLSRATFAAPANRTALAAVVARLVDAAAAYAASSRFGTPALPWRAAWAVLAAADIYGGIGLRVRAAGAAALDRRVTTSTAAKLAAVARALPAALNRSRRWPSPGPSRAGLWTRPQAEL
jgi:phytoene synthase